MTETVHQNLADGKWFALTVAEQLGNIGSEVGRALKREAEGAKDARDKALERALGLIDLTATDPKWRTRLKELERTREVICDLFYGGNTYCTDGKSLDKYFTAFALAARLNK